MAPGRLDFRSLMDSHPHLLYKKDLKYFDIRPPCCTDCSPLIQDRYTGLPLFHTFEDSIFAFRADYVWYASQFRSIPRNTGRQYVAPGCILCSDASWFYPPPLLKSSKFLTLPLLAVLRLDFKSVENAIYDALWEGHSAGLPSNYGIIEHFCRILRSGGVYITTVNFLREIVRRDCVQAFKSILKIYGDNQYPGKAKSRVKFFQTLRQHLLIWQSVHIKQHYYKIVRFAARHGDVWFPRPQDLVKTHRAYVEGSTYVPPYLLWMSEPYVPNENSQVHYKKNLESLAPSLDRTLQFVHCPYQCIDNGIKYSCRCVSRFRWYGLTRKEHLSYPYQHPLDLAE